MSCLTPGGPGTSSITSLAFLSAWVSSLPNPTSSRLGGVRGGRRADTRLVSMEAVGPTAAGGKRPLRRLTPPTGCDNVRVYSISDIHVDYKRNLDWWYEWCDKLKASRGSSYDVVLIPGDVSSNMDTFRSALHKAKESFDAVVIAIGNHDLWVSGTLSSRGIKTSLDKLEAIRELCQELGVFMDPVCIPTPGGKRIFLAPLYSWYHASWDSDPDLPAEAVAILYEGRPSFTDRWSDFRFCKWPEEIISKEDFVSTTGTVTALADHFAAMNDDVLTHTDLCAEARLESDVVISLSHYVPRVELCPEKRFLIEPSLTKVIGSDPLERQVRSLKPQLHVFGHTHIPIDMEVQGTRYLQWPLGSLAEQKRQTTEMAAKGPLLVYDELNGGLIEEIETHWGTYYKTHERDPLQCELAPWVLRFWGVEPRGGTDGDDSPRTPQTICL